MFVELHCHSAYSFLEAAATPEELVAAAAALGMPALALTDTNGLYGAMPFYRACRESGIRPILGSRLTLASGDQIVLLCADSSGYSALSQLITEAHRGQPKGKASLDPRLLAGVEGLFCLCGGKGSLLASLVARRREEEAKLLVRTYQRAFGKRLFVELNNQLEPRSILADQLGVPTVVSNAVQYATPDQGRLCDLLLCMRHGKRLHEAEAILPLNHQRYLKGAVEMAQLWRERPDALARTVEIAEQCSAALDFSAYRFPDFPVPEGETPITHLRRLCLRRCRDEVRQQLEEEIRLIDRLGLAGYFLIVHDIVEYARSQGVWVQGRGSAANSLVAYLLGITPIDPVKHGLFLGRFLHEEMECVPDIDLDFSAARDRGVGDRETVIRYVYEKYGEERVAMVSTHITFRDRSALREVGKVLGIEEVWVDRVTRIAGRSGWQGALDQVGDFKTARAELWLEMASQIRGLPRHLSVHVGGMIIASCPLSRLVPLEPARMAGRIVCQWDKDMVEEAGLIKVDLLGLGMLALLQEASGMIDPQLTLHSVPPDDPEVYRAIGEADTVGLFQIESRAQMQSLPRTRPTNLSELAIQVALIRPGPIQGQMVAPYIRRRQGKESVHYLHPKVEPILKETLGVILFQEQVLQVAIAIAGFSAAQGDQLRRVMSRKQANLTPWRTAFIEGAAKLGVDSAAAHRVFAALEGFALYGFCKSHALAFAHLSYVSAWVRTYHPAAYLAALLNSQPMGFYGRETLIEDAKRRGVTILPVDVQRSGAYCQVEEDAVRLGLFLIRTMGQPHRDQLLSARPFQSLEDLQSRSGLPTASIEQLISAGACDSLTATRRSGWWRLWAREGLTSGLDFGSVPTPELPAATTGELVDGEYESLAIPCTAHPMALLRPHLAGYKTSHQLAAIPTGSIVRVAGRLQCLQRPPTAKGFAFVTLEDEFGMVNVVITPPLFEAHRLLLSQAWSLCVEGTLQKQDGVVNIRALRIKPCPTP